MLYEVPALWYNSSYPRLPTESCLPTSLTLVSIFEPTVHTSTASEDILISYSTLPRLLQSPTI
jgi:hypothetical protein